MVCPSPPWQTVVEQPGTRWQRLQGQGLVSLSQAWPRKSHDTSKLFFPIPLLLSLTKSCQHPRHECSNPQRQPDHTCANAQQGGGNSLPLKAFQTNQSDLVQILHVVEQLIGLDAALQEMRDLLTDVVGLFRSVKSTFLQTFSG